MAEHVDNQSQGLLGKQTSTQYYIPGVALSRGRHVFDGLHKGSLACPLGIERFSPESTRRSIVEHDCSLSPFTGICSPKAYRRRTKYSQLPTAIFPLDQAGVMPAVMEILARYPSSFLSLYSYWSIDTSDYDTYSANSYREREMTNR
ncbi:hypothetical protein AFLA_012735 [Aspergillus flavus NRRL3357]|nr:hypothetical protein AFLA_012735 [Aspergillus flavus NRRL3357]